jgi:hypothetical protein
LERASGRQTYSSVWCEAYYTAFNTSLPTGVWTHLSDSTPGHSLTIVDQDGGWTTSTTGTITDVVVPEDGVYAIAVIVSASTATNRFVISPQINGANYLTADYWLADMQEPVSGYVAYGYRLYPATAGDTIQMWVYNRNAAALGSFRMFVFKVGGPTGGGSGGNFDGNHVLTGDPANPPAELLVNQLLWDGDSTLVSSGTDWTALGLNGSWADFGGGYHPGQYRRVGDIVQFRGLVKRVSTSTSTGANPMSADIPVGFRPPYHAVLGAAYVPTAGGTQLQGQFRVYSTGVVDWTQEAGSTSLTTSGWASLDGLQYSVTT